MSEDRPADWPPLPARRHVCAAEQTPTREERIAHIGELALAWAVAQTAWEDAPRGDQRELRRLMQAADLASERLRAACMVALVHECEVTT